jgi:hypothetical protein
MHRYLKFDEFASMGCAFFFQYKSNKSKSPKKELNSRTGGM